MSSPLDQSLDWMEESDLELQAKPLDYPSTLETETIRTQVRQVKPLEIEGKVKFFDHSPAPIVMAIRRYDPIQKQHVYDWQHHRLEYDNNERFHPLGTFYCEVTPRNEQKLRAALHAKRISPEVVIFGDEHAEKHPAFVEGATEDVHPTRADALGYLRSEARIGIKKQYKEAFKELDRTAANLLGLLYSAIRVNIHDDPRYLTDKLNEVTSSWNLQYLIRPEDAAYWQHATAEDLRISTNDLVSAEGKDSTARFNRELGKFKKELADLHVKSRFHYADESKEPDLARHVERAVELIMPLFELTHPSSSVVASLLYNPEGNTTKTGRNLRKYHSTLRALLRYFGNDARDNTLITDYRNTWGEFEKQARELDVKSFIAAGSWRPLYERGRTLTISVGDLEATLDAVNAEGFQTVVGPIPLGPGRFARFKDHKGKNNEEYYVGLWTPHQKR